MLFFLNLLLSSVHLHLSPVHLHLSPVHLHLCLHVATSLLLPLSSASSSLYNVTTDVFEHTTESYHDYTAPPPPDEDVFRLTSTAREPCPASRGSGSAHRCLDLSAVTADRVVVTDVDGDTDVVVASSVNCSVTVLEVLAPVIIAKSVGSNCKKLTTIVMNGGGWNCSWPGWIWLKEWHEKDGHDNVQTNTTCLGVTQHCNNTCGEFSTGIHYQIACMTAQCEPCQCTFQYNERLTPPVFQATVDCSHRGLSDGQVPRHLPMNADILAFENNSLTDVRELMEQAADMPHLGVINLSNNLLTDVPELLPETAASVSQIYLAGNRIKELKGAALDSYLNRSSVLSIHVKDNPLKCGCEFFEIAMDLRTNPAKRSVLHFFSDFLQIRCPDGSLPKLYPDDSCSQHLPDGGPSAHAVVNAILVVLAIANLLFIALAIDLQLAIYELKQGYTAPRTPHIHVLYVSCSRAFRRLCSSSTVDTGIKGRIEVQQQQEDGLDNRLEEQQQLHSHSLDT